MQQPEQYEQKMVQLRVNTFTRIAGWFLIGLSVLVSIPLTVKTIREGGGPWGFGVIGLAVLLPLCGYVLFGFAGIAARPDRQRNFFLAGHLVTLACGLAGHLIFPVFPNWITLIPLVLAWVGILGRNQIRFFLVVMILLALTANLVLLVWEIEFGRSIPLLQLFQQNHEVTP